MKLEENILRHIPLRNKKRRCPVCKNKVSEYKTFKIQLYLHFNDYLGMKSVDLRFCPYCELPLADKQICKKVYDETGFSVSVFRPTQGSTLEQIKNAMLDETIAKVFLDCGETFLLPEMPPIDMNTPLGKITRVTITNKEELYCPRCGFITEKRKLQVPFGPEKIKVYQARYCSICHSFNIDKKQSVLHYLKDNPYTRNYLVNSRFLWNYTSSGEVYKDRLRLIAKGFPSAIEAVAIKFNDGTVKYFVITFKDVKDKTGVAVVYTSDVGLELLSATHADQRGGKGKIADKEFVIQASVQFVYEEGKRIQDLVPFYLPIKAGGGFFKTQNDGTELVRLLLFSPFINRYETIKATFVKEENCFYTDKALFRAFVHCYGNPCVTLEFESERVRRPNGHYSLNSRSVLSDYGYNVVKGNGYYDTGLSDQKRRELLTELIDLEIRTPEFVIQYLNFFIEMHPGEQYAEARYKWERDRDYIANYKVNTARFLIRPKATIDPSTEG